jgi:hypothetical protein
MSTPARLVCPHCGEYERYKLQSVTDREAVHYCKACLRWSQWERENVSEPWRVREEKE